jgi:lipid-binding SYLF domain-containing protein
MLTRRISLSMPLVALLPAGARADAASTVLAGAEQLLLRFRDGAEWAIVWRQLGNAAGVLIAPRITAEGLLVVEESGAGIVLARHGRAWSDPIGVRVGETSVGLQGGIQEFGLVLAILTSAALDRLIAGGTTYGGSGGFSLGDLGIGSQASVGAAGVETMAVTVSESGVFAGSGVAQMTLTPAPAMNPVLNGAAAPAEVLRREGRHAASRRVRAILAEATRAAGN